MSVVEKSLLAVSLITGKIRNQMNLIKYFHKYHKDGSETLKQKYEDCIPKMKCILAEIRLLAGNDKDYAEKLMALEARSAELYWGYIQELTKDDEIGFTHRERLGANDLFNCLLNYGYAILYARIWRAVLFRKLNPTNSVMHAGQLGKPNINLTLPNGKKLP